MASAMAGTSRDAGHEAMVLSKVYDQLSKSMDVEVLNEININKIFQALDQWDRTIDWIHHNEAKQNGISYFFFTLNKTLYKFVSSAFSNPRIEIPHWARSMREIINILKKIDTVYVSIIRVAKQGYSDKNIATINKGWKTLYGEDKKEDSLIGTLKHEMETFIELVDKSLEPEEKSPILNSQAMMPYDTSVDVLKMHIPLLDAISTSYWEWEKQLQEFKHAEGRDEVAKAVLLSVALNKNVKDKLNNFLFLSSPYKPDFIMVGEHGSERGKVKSYEYNLVALKQGDIVNMPRDVFGSEFFETLSSDMKTVIYKILQISDLSIRRGPFINSGKMVVNLDSPGHLKSVRERMEIVSNEQILNTFRMNLKRFFLDTTFDKDGNEIKYDGVATRRLGIGQMKMLRRLKYISSSDDTRALFAKIIQDKDEMLKVANHIKKSNFQIAFIFKGSDGKKTTGGKRRRKRKTRRRKKKTTTRKTRRKKTKRRKTKRRKTKRRKTKRKKTKRRKTKR